jgi:hypothetical protein
MLRFLSSETHAAPHVLSLQVKEDDALEAKPKRRGKVMSDYERWEIKQLINSGGRSIWWPLLRSTTCCRCWDRPGAVAAGNHPDKGHHATSASIDQHMLRRAAPRLAGMSAASL